MNTHRAASVHHRLLNRARSEGRPFNELLQYYVLERFLYRLCQSPVADRFILKGALLFSIWQSPLSRPTRDVDLLGKVANDIDSLVEMMCQVCTVQVQEDDGLQFHAESLSGEPIIEAADYHGVRIRALATLGNARAPFLIDIGFGDPLVPGPILAELPTLLNMMPPKLLTYSKESVIAEKLHAMVTLGELNSRMKDFYDIWLLSQRSSFDGATLAEAISATFLHRHAAIILEPTAFTPLFAERADKVAQWLAFVRRHPQMSAPSKFSVVTAQISAFLSPVLTALVQGEPFDLYWQADGTWGDTLPHWSQVKVNHRLSNWDVMTKRGR